MKWVLLEMLQIGFYSLFEGKIIEEGKTPDGFFKKPKEERTKLFLSQIL